MKIDSVYVSRLFNEYDYELELCKPLTFIHSPNGMGKSTLMRMIYAALRGDVQYLSETCFERMDIGFDEGSNLIIQNYPGNLLVQMQRSEIETPLTPAEMAQICDVVYIPPERLALKRGDGHLAPTLEVYAQELLETIRYAKEHRELEIDPSEKAGEMSDGELEFWCKDLKAKLDFIRDAGFEPDIPPGAKFPPSRYDIVKDRAGCEAVACSIAHYVERNYLLAESIIIFKDIVNEIFIDKTLQVSETGKVGIRMDNGTALRLQSLSSGEKQILIMFYALLFHAPQGSVVIIDEPEISLHVGWQQKLGDYFLDICRVRDIQMIVSTHSPQIIHDKWDSARELRSTDARSPDLRRHLQRDIDGAHRLRRGLSARGGRHRFEDLREVPGQAIVEDTDSALPRQRGARGQGDEHTSQGPEGPRDNRRRSRPASREDRALPPVLHRLQGHGDDGRQIERSQRRHRRIRRHRQGPSVRGEVRSRPGGAGIGQLSHRSPDVHIAEQRVRALLQESGFQPLHQSPQPHPGCHGHGLRGHGRLEERPYRQEGAVQGPSAGGRGPGRPMEGRPRP